MTLQPRDIAPNARYWPITPTPWVRESNSDKYRPRPRVVRYRAFRDECNLRRVWAPTAGDLVVFLMPMPKSWSSIARARMVGTRHEQAPDCDNLLKAILDALWKDDAHIWTIIPVKVWSVQPGIYIERRDPIIVEPFLPLEGLD